MKLAVFGATGGTGRRLVEQALLAGHDVRALVRLPDRAALPGAVRLIGGNVLDGAAVARTICGADAVASCLGAKLAATYTRRGRIAGSGMARIVAGMQAHGVRRLIAVSTYGAGESWRHLSPAARLMMRTLLWGELADKNAMEAVIRVSGLDWTLARPVNLTDAAATGRWLTDSPTRTVGIGDWIARRDVAAFLLAALEDPATIARAYLLRNARQ
jgi:uncharacterized protein YbjT (DUF2867 family)